MSGIEKNSASPEAQSLIEQHAIRWFVRMHSGACTECDIAEHQNWLNTASTHQKAYQELLDLWGVAGDFVEMPEIKVARKKLKQVTSNTMAGVTTVNINMESQSGQEFVELGHFLPIRQRLFKYTGWNSFAFVVCFLVVFVGSGQLSWLKHNWYDLTRDPVYKTSVGEQKTVILTDGSKLLLDTQTTVRVEFSNEQRRIVLVNGQAYFNVVSDKNRPFIVRAASGVIKAIGTAFVVKKSDKKTLVTLIEGKVAVVSGTSDIDDPSTTINFGNSDSLYADKQEVELYAGQQVAYSENGLTVARLVDLQRETAWQKGRLIFTDYTLADVVEELNRYSYKKIILGDESLAKKRVNGIFKSRETLNAVKTLQTYFLLDVMIDSHGNHVLSPKS